MLAELTEDQPNPSAYFGSQITGHLYDEDAALVPMQSWLERTLRGPVGEINLREQGRQAAEQVSIGNAISSCGNYPCSIGVKSSKAIVRWIRYCSAIRHVCTSIWILIHVTGTGRRWKKSLVGASRRRRPLRTRRLTSRRHILLGRGSVRAKPT